MLVSLEPSSQSRGKRVISTRDKVGTDRQSRLDGAINIKGLVSPPLESQD